MAKTEHYYTHFEEGHFYHIYNRTIDRKPMFISDDNYWFFLKQFDKYLSPVADTYAYCLLPNHFHFLLRIKEEEELKNNLNLFRKQSKLPALLLTETNTHTLVSQQFRKFFQSYSMAFNKQQDRSGTLFQTPFKRALVDSDAYFTQLVYYIHSNPIHHNLTDDFTAWKWSSYAGILSNKTSKLKRDEVIRWFGSRDAYVEYHKELQNFMLAEKYLLD